MIVLHDYPDLQIAYPEDVPPRKEGGDPRISLAFIDGHSHFIVIPETAQRYCTSRFYHSIRSRLVLPVWSGISSPRLCMLYVLDPQVCW